MEFTETEAEILVNCWLLAREGKGQVVQDWALPVADRLEQVGWIKHHCTEDAIAWFWTDRAEQALDLNALTESVKGREN